jgi:gliding motility-associated-like protein
MKRIIVVAVSIFSLNFLYASHVMGGDITYKLVNPEIGRYKFTVTLYRSCAGAPNFFNDSLDIRRNGFKGRVKMTLIEKKEVTPLCLPPDVASKPITNCPGTTPIINGIKGVERNIYEVEVTIGKDIGWAYVGYIEKLRNSEITTGQANDIFYIQSGMNTNYSNNSPVFTTEPIPYWCKNIDNTYNHGAVDTFDERYSEVNGVLVQKDILKYEMICAFNGENPNLSQAANLINPCASYGTGLNKNDFLFVEGKVDFNSESGDISCKPKNFNQDAVLAVAAFEYRAIPNPNGIGYYREKIGYVTRDIQFTIHDQCDPIIPIGVIKDSLINANYISYTEVDICGTSEAKIVFKIKVPNTQNLKSRVTQPLSSQSVYNYRYSQSIKSEIGENVLYGTIQFDSSRGIGQDKFTIQVYYCTTYGIKVSRYYTLLLNFKPAVKVKTNKLYYCIGGKSVRAIVTGATKYSWKADTSIVQYGPDSSWVDLIPAKSQYFYVKGIEGIDASRACTIEDSVRVIVIPRFNYNLSPKNSNICLLDTIQIQLNTQISDTPYKYRWIDPTMGSMFNALNKKSISESNPKIVAIENALYPVEIENKYGCILMDTIAVNLKGVRPNASAFSARNSICPGDTTMLGVKAIPSISGPSIYKTLPEIISKTMTTSIYKEFPTTEIGTAAYPSLFNTAGVGRSSAHRIIYTKAQLTAMGIKPGVIKSISFGFSNLIAYTYDNFEIRLGTSSSVDARWNALSFTVFKQKNYTPILNGGWVKFNFNRGYDWDGKSNLVVETYISSSQPILAPSKMLCSGDFVAGNQFAYKYSDILTENAENSPKPYTSAGATATKPLIRMEYSFVDSSDTNLLKTIWAPSQRITNLINPMVIATPSPIDTIFIAKMGTDFCFDTAHVYIKVDTNLKANILTPSQIICKKSNQVPSLTLNASIKASLSATVNWKKIDVNGQATNLGSQNPQTVNPDMGVWKYVLTVSDAPCFVSDTITITVQDNIPIDLMADMPLCTSASGRLKAILPNGTTASEYKFFWSPTVNNDPTSDSLTYLTANTYTLLIKLKADESCQGIISKQLTAINQELNVSIAAIPISCNGMTSDSLTASVLSTTNAMKYIWNTSLTDTFASIYNKIAKPTKYSVTVLDSKTGCQGQASFLLKEPSELKIGITEQNDVKCKGDNNGKLKVNIIGGNSANGALNYQWTSVEKNQILLYFEEQSGLYADSLHLIVTDSKGCVAQRGFRIDEPKDKLKIDSVITHNATSIGGSNGWAQGYINGGTPNYTYTWKSPIQNTPNTASLTDIYSNLIKGQYSLSVIDNRGCSDIYSFQIKDLECQWQIGLEKQNIHCFGDKTGKIKLNVLETKNPTTIDYTFSLAQNNVVIGTQALAYSSQIQSNTFSNLYAGIYDIQVKTNLGCDTTINLIQLTQNPRLTTNLNVISPSCKGYNDGEIYVKSDDLFRPFSFDFGYGYKSDSFNKIQASGLSKSFSFKNALGCSEKFYYDILEPMGINIKLNAIKPSCYGIADGKVLIDIVPLNPKFPYRYENKPGLGLDSKDMYLNTASEISAGDYRFNIFYANNQGKYCEEPIFFKLDQPDKLEVDKIKVDSVSCPNYADGKIDISLKGGTISSQKLYEYSIDGGKNYFSSNKFTQLNAGTYNIIGRDNNNCIVARREEVLSPETLNILAKTDIAMIKIGDQVKLSFLLSTISGKLPVIQSILWSPSIGLSCVDCSSPIANPYISTLYQLEVRYHKNCITSSSIEVNVQDYGDLFIPSAFTPRNKDGLNDNLMVYGFGIKSLRFSVYNRWGEKVFECDQLSKGWDGVFKNEAQTSGVYSYIAEVEYLNGTKQIKKGSSTLIR